MQFMLSYKNNVNNYIYISKEMVQDLRQLLSNGTFKLASSVDCGEYDLIVARRTVMSPVAVV